MEAKKLKRDALFWHLMWAFYVPSTLIATAYGILAPVLPVYAGNLTSAFVLVGIILAAEHTGRMIGDVPASWFMRRFGVKQTMMIGLWLALIPMVLLFFVQDVWLPIVLLFVSGFGHALYNISRHAYITIIIRKSLRGRAISAVGGVFRVGKFAGPLIGGIVGGTLGLNAAFLAFSFITLLTMFFVWRFMFTTEANDLSLGQDSQTAIFTEVFQVHGKVLLSAGAGQIFAQLTRAGWSVLIPLYAASVLKLDVVAIGYIISVGAAFDMLFFLSSGFIMDRFGRKWAIIPSFVLQAIGVGLILLVSDSFQLAMVAGFIGFANALSSGSMMTLGSDLAPPHLRGEFLSIWRLIGDAGFVAGPMVIGIVAQTFVFSMSIMSITGAGLGAAFLFAFFVPETLKSKVVARTGD